MASTEREIQMFKDLLGRGVNQDRAKALIIKSREPAATEPIKEKPIGLAERALGEAEKFITPTEEIVDDAKTIEGELIGEDISGLDVGVKAGKAISEFGQEFKREGVALPTTKEEAFEALKVTGINLVPDAIEGIGEVIELASDPIGVIKTMNDLGQGIIHKGLTSLWNAVTGDDFEGTEKEKIAEAAGQYLSDNFGTLDKASKTITENPVDTIFILKNIIKSAKNIVKPNTIKNLEKIEKTLPQKLDEAARVQVEKALGTTKEKFKQKGRELAPEILERGIKGSKEEIKLLAETKADEFGKKIQDFVESGKLKGSVKSNDLVKVLEEIKAEGQIGDVIIDDNIVNASNKFIDVVKAFGDDIPAEKARLIRQMFDKAVYNTKGVISEEALSLKNNIKKALGDEIRKQLALQNPELAGINKEFSFYSKLDEVLTETINRQGPQQGGLISTIAGGGGLGAGAIIFGDVTGAIASAVVVKGLTEAMKSTKWRLISAGMKNKLARALSAGDTKTSTKIAKDIIRKTLGNKANIYIGAQATESNLELNK